MTSIARLSPRTVAHVVAAIYVVLLGILLLSPEPVERILGLNLGDQQGVAEQVANILIFIPIGFTAAQWLTSKGAAVIVGLLVSLGVEVAQFLWLPVRDASWADVVKNLLGTAIGALLVRAPRTTAPPPALKSPR